MPRPLPRERADLDERIRQQVRVLRASAGRFDEGGSDADDEALTMVACLRTLIYSSDKSTPALELTGHLPGMRFCDSVLGPPPRDPPLFIAAVKQVINLRPEGHERHVSFLPALGHHLKQLPPGQQAVQLGRWPTFDQWWSAVLVRDHTGRAFTRKALVRDAAHSDVLHLSKELPRNYARLSREPGFIGLSIRLDDEGAEHYAGDPVPSLLRQVTWETLRTLERFAPEYV